MGFQEFQRIGIGAPAAPAKNATVPLFDSTVAFNKMGLRALGIARIKFDFAGLDQPSATNGLKGYKSNDKGTTWYDCSFSVSGASGSLPTTVAADTGTDSMSYDIFIGTAEDVKFTFTASATGPTIWPPIITCEAGNVNSGS